MNSIFKQILLITFLMKAVIYSLEYKNPEDSLETTRKDYILYDRPLTLKSINEFKVPLKLFTEFSEFRNLNVNFYEIDKIELQKIDYDKIQNNLLINFKQSMQWKDNYSLGEFGKYLGYAMSAAAVGLAVKHIVKYKEKALFGK